VEDEGNELMTNRRQYFWYYRSNWSFNLCYYISSKQVWTSAASLCKLLSGDTSGLHFISFWGLLFCFL